MNYTVKGEPLCKAVLTGKYDSVTVFGKAKFYGWAQGTVVFTEVSNLPPNAAVSIEIADENTAFEYPAVATKNGYLYHITYNDGFKADNLVGKSINLLLKGGEKNSKILACGAINGN